MQAEKLLEQVTKRLEGCKLRVNAEKTQLVYCKDSRGKGGYHQVRFEFLGYSFYPIRFRSQFDGSVKLGFDLAMSKSSSKRLLEEVESMKELSSRHITLEAMARELNPQIRGWLKYYGKFKRYKMRRILYFLDKKIAHWLRQRYKE